MQTAPIISNVSMLSLSQSVGRIKQFGLHSSANGSVGVLSNQEINNSY
jgi:hypothetical protein